MKKIRRFRALSLFLAAAVLGLVPLAGQALAAPPAVVGNITGDPLAPGEEATLSFTISPTGRSLTSFTLTPPANWQLVSDQTSPSPGDPPFRIVSNTLEGSPLNVAPSSSVTVQFRVRTGCLSGNWEWQLDARDAQGRRFGNDASDLTTNVNGNCTLGFATQPSDALKNKLITGTAFTTSTNFVQVEVLNGATPIPQRVTYFPVGVSFDLATEAGLASGSLSAATKTTVNGVATFSGADSTLSIGTLNEPQFTDYRLKPKTVGTYAGLTGSNSSGFDIWEAACSGSGCAATLRGGRDEYKTTANTVLSASTLPSSALAISCPGQKLIFQDDVFVHETSGPDAVIVTSHITAQDFRAAGANFGQANVEWCVGIKPDDARALGNGGTYAPVDVDGDNLPDLYVGFAPRCPSKSPELSAPCIVSQSSDGKMGSITTGYLQGGDPPRRT
jgi:hypothetical protein